LSGWRGGAEAMRVRRLTAVEEEAGGMKSLYFVDELSSRATPGQYVMMWNPEAEEVPMSLSTIDSEGQSSVLVRPVGESTEALCGLEKGGQSRP